MDEITDEYMRQMILNTKNYTTVILKDTKEHKRARCRGYYLGTC